MDKTCILCFDDMDMVVFNDTQSQTSTCFKLDCGHAFHTHCIIRCLQHMNHKCPHCNSRKNPETILSMEGTVIKLLKEAKRTHQLRNEMAEFKESKNYLTNSIKELKKETTEFVKKRKEELMITEKRKQLNTSIRKVNLKLEKICIAKGPMYQAAFRNMPEWRRNKLIFSKTLNLFRLRHTYVNCKV
jgi:hypothetical protein